MKSGNLNFLEPTGPPQACNGTALPLLFMFISILYMFRATLCHHQEKTTVSKRHLVFVTLRDDGMQGGIDTVIFS
jgi:hypothetical protein